MRRRDVVMIAACMLLVVSAGPASAATTVNGGGSTWSQIAIDQWRVDVQRYGVNVNYSGVGSSTGRALFISGQVDFAVSEIPFDSSELKALKRSYQYLPIVAGGTSMFYQLKGTNNQPIKGLQLSSASAAAIFFGTASYWDDTVIKKDQTAAVAKLLPHSPVIPVIRSDGSGTSAQFSAYLAATQPAAWKKFSQAYGQSGTFTSFWPTFDNGAAQAVAQQGSDGVANFVANEYTGNGTIGYAEAGYALQRGLPIASVRNASNRYVQPTSDNVATALRHATFYSNNTQNLTGVYRAPEATAYPISSYSYMITQTKGFDPAKGETLSKFILYFVCTGQQQASTLGYSPLPPNLVENAFAAVANIPGHVAVPKLTDCPNPTIKGAGDGTYIPGEDDKDQEGQTDDRGGGKGDKEGGGTGASGATGPEVTGASGIGGTGTGSIDLAGGTLGTASTPACNTDSSVPMVLGALGLLALVFGPATWRRSQARRGDP